MNKKEKSAQRRLDKFHQDQQKEKDEELKYNVDHGRRRNAERQYIEAELDRLYEEGKL